MSSDEAKLFVAGLPDNISEEALKQLFEATGGAVVSVSLPRERETGKIRGFGFVTFGTAQEAQAAREALDGSLQAGRSISVRPFEKEPPRRGDGKPLTRSDAPRGPGGPPGQDRTLYVGNLPYDCTQEEVDELLQTVCAGQVARIQLPSDPATGRKRGFGFVTMATVEAAKTAADALKAADLRGRRLIVNMAQPKGERPPREGGFGASGSYAAAAAFVPPPGPPPRRFEEKKKKTHGGEFEDGPRKRRFEGGGGGGRRRGGGGWDTGGDDDG